MHREAAERLCRRFNEEWPVGSIVCYIDDGGLERVLPTRAEAHLLASGLAVVELRDLVFSCELERIVPMSRPDDFGSGILEEVLATPRSASDRQVRFPDRHKEK